MELQKEHYLQTKYGHSYKFLDYADIYHNSGDIIPWQMVTMPMPTLVDIYKQEYHVAPKSFIDCGAGFGYMLWWASIMGIDAYGVEIRKYPFVDFIYKKYSRRIKIANLLDSEPFNQDLAYANCVFSYMQEQDIDVAMGKFQNVKMLIAIHNTTEDIAAAKRFGTPLDMDAQNRLLRPNEWWINRFRQNGFDARFIDKYSCFCAVPKTR